LRRLEESSNYAETGTLLFRFATKGPCAPNTTQARPLERIYSFNLSMATEDQPMEGALAPENERSPSPAPPPPVAAAPGPRATALQKLYGDAIAHVLKTCSYSNFASCFPTPAKQVPDSLRHLHEQFTDRLGASMRTNFEQILTERNVVPSLNELDGLIEDAKKRKMKAEEDADGQPVQTPVP
jgi:hypothetical protein